MQQIIIAVISGLCVAIPSIITTLSSNKKNNDLIIYRINELEKKVSKHNNVVERMYEAEKKITLLENEVNDIKSAK
jgi:Cu/Ag efflux protein CusF